MRSFALVPLAVALVAASPAATAQNWAPLLKDTPFERFNKDDNAMFLEHARKALEETKDNETVSWENPATKHGGSFTVLSTTEKEGRTCKSVRVRTQAETLKRDNVANLCRVEGKWRLLSPSQAR